MPAPPSQFQDVLFTEVLIAIRRIMQAVVVHSRYLAREYGLTGPQLFVLNTLHGAGGLTVSELARRVNVSQATMTGILLRLEKHGLVERRRSAEDKRRVIATVTPAGRRILASPPPMLQQTFMTAFARLEPWEQSQILSSLHRVASLMEAAPGLEADPFAQAPNRNM